ncbi:MAG: hypothetical protein QME96_01545, partial [Myxococcota bacterium]|nr:hypothetical protein [Myxococcota bacterium]
MLGEEGQPGVPEVVVGDVIGLLGRQASLLRGTTQRDAEAVASEYHAHVRDHGIQRGPRRRREIELPAEPGLVRLVADLQRRAPLAVVVGRTEGVDGRRPKPGLPQHHVVGPTQEALAGPVGQPPENPEHLTIVERHRLRLVGAARVGRARDLLPGRRHDRHVDDVLLLLAPAEQSPQCRQLLQQRTPANTAQPGPDVVGGGPRRDPVERLEERDEVRLDVDRVLVDGHRVQAGLDVGQPAGGNFIQRQRLTADGARGYDPPAGYNPGVDGLGAARSFCRICRARAELATLPGEREPHAVVLLCQTVSSP